MKKALLVSFFNSNNLGDLALSNAMENLIKEKGYSIIKYDFLTVTPINENKDFVKINNNILKKSWYRSILSKIKKVLITLIGNKNFCLIQYQIRKQTLSKNWGDLEEKMENVDILIIGGGNMLMDINPSWPDIFSKYILTAKRKKKEIYVVNVGAGPIKYKRSKNIYRKMLNLATQISVRDSLSKEVCESLDINNQITNSIDPVFSLPLNLFDYRISQINEISEDKVVKIGVSVLGKMCFSSKKNHDYYLETLLKLIEKISCREKIEFVLFSTEIADYKAIHKFSERLKLSNYRIVPIKNVNEIIALYKDLNFLVGGRMHGMIFAQRCLLPFIGFVWQEKIKGFANVTNSSGFIYEIKDIHNNTDDITRQVFSNMQDKNLVKEMHETNKSLLDVVQNENVIN